MKKFINTEQQFNEDGSLDIWTKEEVKEFYQSLKDNGEYNACHLSFEEWLLDQEQFQEIDEELIGTCQACRNYCRCSVCSYCQDGSNYEFYYD